MRLDWHSFVGVPLRWRHDFDLAGTILPSFHEERICA